MLRHQIQDVVDDNQKFIVLKIYFTFMNNFLSFFLAYQIYV